MSESESEKDIRTNSEEPLHEELQENPEQEEVQETKVESPTTDSPCTESLADNNEVTKNC